MVFEQIQWLDTESIDQIAGFTGIGWTTSFLAYLSLALGYGNSFVSRLITDPQSLLYLGTVFFVTTLGLDRLTESLSEE